MLPYLLGEVDRCSVTIEGFSIAYHQWCDEIAKPTIVPLTGEAKF